MLDRKETEDTFDRCGSCDSVAEMTLLAVKQRLHLREFFSVVVDDLFR
jgi:hypothetical protein